MYGNLDIEIIDFIDLIDNTLSSSFTEKWKHKYSEKFIKLFQLKILTALSNRKPIKIDSLYNYFTKKGRYSPEVVINFFNSIEIELYNPVITGQLTKGPTSS
tara:strand:- start:83 stop:388 length:306 start_codon:yes stop_codon:yes gene_type:complete